MRCQTRKIQTNLINQFQIVYDFVQLGCLAAIVGPCQLAGWTPSPPFVLVPSPPKVDRRLTVFISSHYLGWPLGPRPMVCCQVNFNHISGNSYPSWEKGLWNWYGMWAVSGQLLCPYTCGVTRLRDHTQYQKLIFLHHLQHWSQWNNYKKRNNKKIHK